jgi:hypothetical protein
MRGMELTTWRAHVHDEYCESPCHEETNAVLEGAWAEIVGDRKLTLLYAVEYGFAEETIAMMGFESGSYEVGIGESLRPYDRLYLGIWEHEAENRFWQAVTLHTRNM